MQRRVATTIENAQQAIENARPTIGTMVRNVQTSIRRINDVVQRASRGFEPALRRTEIAVREILSYAERLLEFTSYNRFRILGWSASFAVLLALSERRSIVAGEWDANWKIALQISRSEPDADDAVQQACVNFLSIPHTTILNDPRAYFATIVRNEAFKRTRNHRPISLTEPSSHSRCQDDAVSERSQALKQEFSRLPPADAQLLTAFVVDGRTAKELADEYDMTVEAVWQRLRRTLKVRVIAKVFD